MSQRFTIAVLIATSMFSSGCAPWSSSQPSGYVTVEADSSHDTKRARETYHAARKCLEKHSLGKNCDFEQAEKLLRESLAADVRFGPAHHSLGVLYFWQGKLYLAAWEFEYAARVMPDRFEPLNNLGLVYESAGKYEQAKSFYLLAREKSHTNPEVIANLARASYRNSESVDQMRPLLDDVLATDPRPEWRHWASELLGLNPVGSTKAESVAIPSAFDEQNLPPSPDEIKQPEEELPLIPPPPPSLETSPVISDEDLRSALLQVAPTERDSRNGSLPNR